MLRASLVTGLSRLNAKAEKRGEERSAGFKLCCRLRHKNGPERVVVRSEMFCLVFLFLKIKYYINKYFFYYFLEGNML
jgi:hypothetical protein